MKKYTLEYRTGWGEKIKLEFKAHEINTALLMARNYCKQHFVSVAHLTSPKGKEYLV
jgi:hypothetical protein